MALGATPREYSFPKNKSDIWIKPSEGPVGCIGEPGQEGSPGYGPGDDQKPANLKSGFGEDDERPPAPNESQKVDAFKNPLPGIPPYPLAIGTPLDRTYLRPLQQPLYDTEYFAPTKGIKEMSFFGNVGYDFEKRQYKKYLHFDEEKTRNDSNLSQNFMLCYPLEFSILGFNVIIDPKTSQEDRNALLSNGAHFRFNFAGNREYLNIPLTNVCSRKFSEVSPGHAIAQVGILKSNLCEEVLRAIGSQNYSDPDEKVNKHEIDDDKETMITLAAKLLEKSVYGDSFYKFNLGRSALKIRPGEAFNAVISWKKTPQVSRPVKIIVELIGLLWMPM